MMRQQRRPLVLALPVPLQPLGEARVQQRPLRLQQALVGDPRVSACLITYSRWPSIDERA
jgi:hypothetical protein